MPIHFTEDELARRRSEACRMMENRGVHGLLMFRQESMYYLTGYDTFGYVHFQALYLGADGAMTLLTRAPDRLQAKQTSVIENIRIWIDREGATPGDDLRELMADHGCKGQKIGIELEAYGLTARKGKMVEAALDGFCTLEDASDLVSRLRLVKSPAELAYVRRASELVDAAYDEAVALARPGAFEGDIIAAMQSAIYRGGGDDPANEHIIGSGPQALLCRYQTGRRTLEADDQLTLEFAGVYRHYHSCLMRTFKIGTPPSPAMVDMHKAATDSLVAAEAALKPGSPIGEVFDAHASVLDEAGYKHARMNACGYSLGTTFAPNWMDWPMFYHGNPVIAEPGMVFFIHIIIFDEDKGLAMTHGRTSEVTETGSTPLSKSSLEFVGA
ncbi:MAG: Xaa-Pro peptidase family protein [Pseudomonadota bacterium]